MLRSFPWMDNSLAAAGFEAAVLRHWRGWKSHGVGQLRIKGMRSVMLIASMLCHNPSAGRLSTTRERVQQISDSQHHHHLSDPHGTEKIGGWYRSGASVPTRGSSSNRPHRRLSVFVAGNPQPEGRCERQASAARHLCCLRGLMTLVSAGYRGEPRKTFQTRERSPEGDLIDRPPT